MDDKVIELYKQCGNGGLVAKQLGINNYKVYSILRKHGIQPKKIGGKAKHSVQDMQTMYESGMCITDIAQQLDMNPSSIWERLKNNGCVLRSKQEAWALSGRLRIVPSQEQEVIDMYLSGMSSTKIAVSLGLQYKDQVLAVLKRHGIQARDNFGSNNPAWKGGKVPLNKLIRNSQKYTDFVKHIMYSRDYTCQLTGERGGKLNVHHIKSFASLVDGFMVNHGHVSDREQLNQAIENYTPFWDESNVMLITEEEHKKIHY